MITALILCRDIKVQAPWIDTGHQPGDGGTRSRRGEALQIGPVRWDARRTLLQVFIADANLAQATKEKGFIIKNWYSGSSRTSILARPIRRALLKLVEKGTMLGVFWALPQVKPEDEAYEEIGELIAQGIVVGTSVDTPFVVYGSPNNELWKCEPLLRAFTYSGARLIDFDLCQYGCESKLRRRFASNHVGVAEINLQCRAPQGRCTVTGLHHVDPRTYNSDRSASGPRGLPLVLCRTLVTSLSECASGSHSLA